LKINFTGFWPGFAGDTNPMFLALKNNFENVSITTNPLEADIVYYSIFAQDYPLFNQEQMNFLYVGESNQYIEKTFKENYMKMLPFVNLLGPEFTNSMAKSSFRLTEWMWQIRWDKKNRDINLLTTKDLSRRKKLYLRTDKGCFVSRYGNHEWLSDRIKYVNKFDQEFKKVDKYGYEIPLAPGYRNKINVQKKYLYQLAFENNVSNGYVTEKLLHALVVGGIVLYYGDEAAKKDFNPNSFIYFNNEESFNHALEQAKLISSSRKKLRQITKEPIFQYLPSLDGLSEYTYSVIKNPI
jgi:hypothetical protein